MIFQTPRIMFHVNLPGCIQDITGFPRCCCAGNQATVWTGLYLGFELYPGIGSRLPIITHTIRPNWYMYLHFATKNQAKCRKIYVPGTCLSSILVVEPFKTRSFLIKTRVIWVPGIPNTGWVMISDCFWSMGTWSTKVMCWYCWRLEILADKLRVHWKSWGKNNEIFTRSLGGGLKHF